MKIIDWYSEYNGEPEIQIKIYSKQNVAVLLICMWEGYFDDLMYAIKPIDGKWGEMALQYHLCTGWYNDEWTINKTSEVLNELKSINTDLINTNEHNMLRQIICIFEKSIINGYIIKITRT